MDSVVATRRLSGARLRAVGGRRKTLTRLLFDESLAELADELLLLDDEDVSAADAEAPRRNARIASLEATTPSFFSDASFRESFTLTFAGQAQRRAHTICVENNQKELQLCHANRCFPL